MSEPKKTTIMFGLGMPDGKDGKDGDKPQVSQECIDAALDVAEALGISRDKIDGEDLAMALMHFDDVCEDEDDGEDGRDGDGYGDGYGEGERRGA